MIEVKNLTKTYHPKKGVPVVALDNVNLKIEDKGLVFILGKSGSGKSTLLNLLGGLDKYDAGDIIIKGKSTKDFTQGNFDSYRNTYVGFIFQEYNILEEFTVGANIALAIELQGRKATNEEVKQILDTLDLTGYGHRRPNELSGGQRQRVAIARALVKNPEIILADEPTGSLDSKTALQIFDILKKLSQEKLVMVVSHDREFAEMYGDRVIELADGRIISDISKTTVTSEVASNVQYAQNEGLIVREGYKLTAADLEMINRYLEKEKKLNIITKNDRDFRTHEVFVETEDVDLKSYDEEFKMIKSRLPNKMAFRMGASGLGYKKLRLFFTILLSLIAFTLFGVADSLAAYNKIDAIVNSIIDGNIQTAALTKEETYLVNEDEHTRYLSFSMEDVEELNSGIGRELGLNFKPVYAPGSNPHEVSFWLQENYSRKSRMDYVPYFQNMVSGLAEFSREELLELGFTIHGEMPEADDEIALTDYVFKHFEMYGYSNYNEKENKYSDDIEPGTIKNYQQLIGREIVFNNSWLSNSLRFKVTAIVNTNFDTTRYETLKNSDSENYFLREEFRTIVQFGYHALGFVSEGAIGKLIEKSQTQGLNIRNIANLTYRNPEFDMDNYWEYWTENLEKVDNYGKDKIVFFDEQKTALGKNEILIEARRFLSDHGTEVQIDDFQGNLSTYYDMVINEHFENYARENYHEAEANGFFEDMKLEDDIDELTKIWYYLDYLHGDGRQNNPYGSKSGYELEAEAFQICAPVLGLLKEVEVEKYFYNNIIYKEELSEAKIVGVYYGEPFSNLVIVDDEFYDELEALGKEEPYKFVLAKMPEDRSNIQKLAKFSNTTTNSVSHILQNETTRILEMANNMVENLAHTFLFIGLGFAGFSTLMLSNFIASSINQKRREIGILRAIGARSNDVFRIFFNESIIIATINFFLASISTFIVVRAINLSLRTDVGLSVTIFNFSLRQIVLVLLISVFVALTTSFMPVYRIARKKPVDAIRDK